MRHFLVLLNLSVLTWPALAETPHIFIQPKSASRPMPTATPPHPIPMAEGEDPAIEIEQTRREQIKAYDALNALNPTSEQFGKDKDAQNLPDSLKNGPGAQLYQLLSNPAVQGYLKFFSNPSFSKGIQAVAQSPYRMILLYAELGLFLFMLVFRAWRMSKVNHWAKRIWTNFWTFGMGLVLGVAVVPAAVMGIGWLEMLWGGLQVLLKA